MERTTKDTGEREVFSTGARRDGGDNKPVPLISAHPVDLMRRYGFSFDYSEPLCTLPSEVQDKTYAQVPDLALNRLQALFERGAVKYGENNWEKGIPLQRIFESMIRHLIQAWAGDTSEDHLAAVLWNAATAMVTEHRIVEGDLLLELGDAGAIKFGKHYIEEINAEGHDTGHDMSVLNGGT